MTLTGWPTVPGKDLRANTVKSNACEGAWFLFGWEELDDCGLVGGREDVKTADRESLRRYH